jgi:hypothetical protein
MFSVTGRLEFTGWFNRPWKLHPLEGGEPFNLYLLINESLKVLNGKRTTMDFDKTSFRLRQDEESEFVVEYREDEIASLTKVEGFGFSNLGHYIPHSLQMYNGRKVTFTAHDDGGYQITPDDTEVLNEVWFGGTGNLCPISDDVVKDVCRPGTTNTCIFLVAGGRGFECAKFCSATARGLLDRYHNRNMRASRIGNCKLMGRKD